MWRRDNENFVEISFTRNGNPKIYLRKCYNLALNLFDDEGKDINNIEEIAWT